MSIVRKHRPVADNYTVISNDWVRDENLSYAAIGLLTQLMSHREGWQVSIRSLAGKHKAGRDAIRTIVAELEAAGYLVRSQTRENGTSRFGETLWETREPEPVTGEPLTAFPTSANPTTKKTIDKEEQTKEIDIVSEAQEVAFEQFWSAYPRKTDKAAARRIFNRIKPELWPEVIAGAVRYAHDPNLPESVFQKHPKTWLNAEAWDNPPLPPRKKTRAELVADRERENAERRARYEAEEQDD